MTDLYGAHNIPIPIPLQGDIQPPHDTKSRRDDTGMNTSIKVHGYCKERSVPAFTTVCVHQQMSQNTGARLIASFLQTTPLMKRNKHDPPAQNAFPRIPMRSAAAAGLVLTIKEAEEVSLAMELRDDCQNRQYPSNARAHKKRGCRRVHLRYILDSCPSF